jgi:hypothetical protein
VSSTILLTSPPFDGAWRWLSAASMTEKGVGAFQLSLGHRTPNQPDQLRVRPSSDRNGTTDARRL